MFYIEECKVTLLNDRTYQVTYLGENILLKYETEPSQGDEIYSVYFPKLKKIFPYWCYLRNIMQISIDESPESLYLSIDAVKSHQWSGIVNIIIDPKNSRYACLEDWYPCIKVEGNTIHFYNKYTRNEYILKDFKELNWLSIC